MKLANELPFYLIKHSLLLSNELCLSKKAHQQALFIDDFNLEDTLGNFFISWPNPNMFAFELIFSFHLDDYIHCGLCKCIYFIWIGYKYAQYTTFSNCKNPSFVFSEILTMDVLLFDTAKIYYVLWLVGNQYYSQISEVIMKLLGPGLAVLK